MKSKLCLIVLLTCLALTISSCGQGNGSERGNSPAISSSVPTGEASKKPGISPEMTTLDRLFRNGPVCVQAPSGLWGFVNKEGNYVIQPMYEEASSFSKDGLALVRDPNSGLYGFINTSGAYAIEPQFITAKAFSQDRAAVVDQNYKRGYIDISGTYVLELPFCDQLGSFSNDRAFVYHSAAGSFDGGWAMIDWDGNELTEPIFDQAESVYWNDGICNIHAMGKDGYIFINEQGEIVAPQDGSSFPNIGYFSTDGLCYAEDSTSHLWGYIDRSGAWVISPRYTGASHFSEGRAMARDNESGLWGMIDTEGNWIVEPQYTIGSPAASYGRFLLRDGEKYTLIDKNGVVLYEYDFPDALGCSIFGNTLRVGFRHSDGVTYQFQLYNIDGTLKSDTCFSDSRYIVSDSAGIIYAIVKADGAWGVIDGDGNWLIPASYLDIKL